MIVRVFTAAVVSAAALLAAPVPAQAQIASVVAHAGPYCRLAATPSVSGGSTWTGVVDGGPVVAAVMSEYVQSDIVLRCSIQIIWYDFLDPQYHYGYDVVSVSSPSGHNATYLPPTPVSFDLLPTQVVYLCSEAILRGDTYYYDAAAGTWSNVAGTACGVADRKDVEGLPAP